MNGHIDSSSYWIANSFYHQQKKKREVNDILKDWISESKLANRSVLINSNEKKEWYNEAKFEKILKIVKNFHLCYAKKLWYEKSALWKSE